MSVFVFVCTSICLYVSISVFVFVCMSVFQTTKNKKLVIWISLFRAFQSLRLWPKLMNTVTEKKCEWKTRQWTLGLVSPKKWQILNFYLSIEIFNNQCPPMLMPLPIQWSVNIGDQWIQFMLASQRNGKFCMFYVGLEFSIADITQCQCHCRYNGKGSNCD
jgi:hypothetical protein